MVVRAWEEKDIDTILEIERRCFKDPYTREMLLWDMEGMFGYTFLIEDEGQVCGYASMNVLFEDAEVGNVAVDEPFRRRGYGKILMDAMHEKAKELGAKRVLLEVRVSNAPAVRLYESLGYERFSVRKRYYSDGEDAYMMQKRL